MFPQPVFVQDLPGAKNPSRSSSSNNMNSAQNSDGQMPPNLDDMPSLPSQPKNSSASNMTPRDMRSVVAGVSGTSGGTGTASMASTAVAGPGSFQGIKQAAMYNANANAANASAGVVSGPNAGGGALEAKPPLPYPVQPTGQGGLNANTTSIATIATITSDQKKDQNQQTASFNGIGKCAVFPVPVSSFNISVWSTIREVSSSDLTTNPFNLVSLSISELLELTLPPVDASGISPWPKPVGHYTQFIGGQQPPRHAQAVENSTFGPPSLPPPPQQQQQQQLQQQQQQQHQQQQQQQQQEQQQPPANNSNIAGLQQMLGIKVQGGGLQK